MSTLELKLNYLYSVKRAIGRAITEKGVSVNDADTFLSYANKIRAIQGGTSGPGGSEIAADDFLDILYSEPFKINISETIRNIDLTIPNAMESVFINYKQVVNNAPDTTPFNAGDTIHYTYTGDKHSVHVASGIYRLPCQGAQGGFRSSSDFGGWGGFARGVIRIESAVTFFIYPGGAGNNGGFNGGGVRQGFPNNRGGGASDIRIGVDDLLARVIVGGGGSSDGASNKPGKRGGGENGESATESYGTGGQGATQTAPGTGDSAVPDSRGQFGIGGTGINRSGGFGGAGGGGWFGGAGGYPDTTGDDDRGGGGGSGYVLTSASHKPAGYLLSNAYFLTETILSQGGNAGNGLVVLEIIEKF